jgi:hypothetical protein
MRRRRWVAAVALGAALAVGLAADGVAAKKKRKERLTALVDGKKFRARDFNTSAPGASPFLIGGTKPRVGTIIRSLEVTCLVPLPELEPPVTLSDRCTVRYNDFRFGGAEGGTTRRFRGENETGAVQVTIESFDGSRLIGTFGGTLAAVDASDEPLEAPPVTVENGYFSVVLDD